MAETDVKKKNFNPARFYKEVRSEMKKVTWPTRQEMITSCIFVFVMVTIIAIFLYVSDQIIAWLINLILSL